MPTFPFEVVVTSIFQPNMVEYWFQVSAGLCWATLVLLTPIYFLLHIYLEAIMPNAYGVTETCCFCFRKRTVIADDDDDVEADLFLTADKGSSIQEDGFE